MVERVYVAALRMRPFVLVALMLILAACNQNSGSSGAGGPGY